MLIKSGWWLHRCLSQIFYLPTHFKHWIAKVARVDRSKGTGQSQQLVHQVFTQPIEILILMNASWE